MKIVGDLARRYLKSFLYFYRRLGYRVFIRMVLGILVGVLDGFGIAMFLPLLQLADSAAVVDPSGLGKLGFLVESIENSGFELNLVTILLFMSFFFILKGLVHYVTSMYNVVLRQYFIKSIRINLTEALGKMSYNQFVLADAGRIQNTLSGEVMAMSKAYQSYFGAFQQIILIAVYLAFAFSINANFTLLICVGGGLTNFIYRRLYKSTKVSSRHLTRNTNQYQGLIFQFVTNFKYLKATRYINDYNQKLKKSIDDIEENNRKIGQLIAIIHAMREPVLIVVVSLVIFAQVQLFNGALQAILISLLFFYRALAALILLQTYYNEFLAVSGSMENMQDFERELRNSREKDGRQWLRSFKHSIELKEVSFTFSEKTVLKNINLQIFKNQTVAFVGESGSGKTTLLNVLSGLLPPEGEMFIDGISRTDIKIESYSRRIGYITQEPVIFNDTVFNNVSFWAAPTPENYRRFNWAVEQASIGDFIKSLPEKENSVLGNNGINLSGGQKQRISIARELYKDVDILVLDEATSSLDSETEEAIQKGIENLKGRYTILIVAHRLSTVKNADKIMVMSKGEIVDEGSFGSLLVKSIKFKKMVDLQEVQRA